MENKTKPLYHGSQHKITNGVIHARDAYLPTTNTPITAVFATPNFARARNYACMRLIADGCGDCKSYTMFIACCLHCCGILCIVRFVNFDGGKQYTHVYPVAIDEQGREIVMDACELDNDNITVLYNYARPYTKKKDIYYE